AHAAGNYRWAAELLNHLVFADGNNSEAKLALADAYEQLGFQAESGAWRNYYLSAVANLRGDAPANTITRQQSADYVDAIPTLDLFNALATRLAASEAVAQPQFFSFIFTDTNEVVTVERRGMIEIPRLEPSEASPVDDARAAPPTAEVRTTRSAFAALLLGRAQAPALMAAGQLAFSGDVAALQAWLSSHAPPTPGFAVVTP
ncbi:MAG: alkyl sulfatase dimerization domain-containing protein, partial [Sphingopyxis sp.]